MRLMLLAFAGSVLCTRAFLALTGYPQIAGGPLHIAHALWGGLLLFAAALVPLLVVNRAAFAWAALLTGAGVGLFIDEVGKLITADSDYFFPAAAPIAYALFLLAVLLYVRVRRSRALDARAQLYAALELIKDALDHDLSAHQRAELEARLRAAAARADSPDRARLARGLLDLTRPGVLTLAPSRPGIFRRLVRRLDSIVDRWATERRLRLALAAGLALLGILSLGDLVTIIAIGVDLADRSTSHVIDVANSFARIEIVDRSGVDLLLVRAGLDVAVGLVLLIAGALLVLNKPRRGLALAQVGLLLSLTVLNLLVFYFVQFAAAISALAQIALLYMASRYQDHYADGDR